MANKADLINKMAEKLEISKSESERSINACMESIKEVLGNDDKLKIIGFGTFAVSNQKERKGRNPQTGEEIKIPERKVVRFKPGKNLKEEIISS